MLTMTYEKADKQSIWDEKYSVLNKFLPVNNSSSKELPGDCRAATGQKTDKKSERLPLVLREMIGLQKISFWSAEFCKNKRWMKKV